MTLLTDVGWCIRMRDFDMSRRSCEIIKNGSWDTFSLTQTRKSPPAEPAMQ
jgi:hypothetical protein